MPKGIKGYQKGHQQYNTGRTHFKKGMIPWNKGKHIATNRVFYDNNPMRNPDIVNRVKKILKGKKKKPFTAKHKENMSLSRKELFKKGKLKSILKDKTYEEYFGGERAKEIKRKQSLKSKGKPKSEEHRKKIKKNRAKQILPKYDTTIEIKIQNFLKELGIEYFTHQHMKIEHSYQCDILIPSMNLVIECDGDYWHKYPTGTEIDNIRTSELLSKGFKVLRLWEKEIKIMGINDFKLKIQGVGEC